jgi:hypothetical protein
MGAERFFNIKCRASGLRPDAAVLVVTVRALKTHSGRFKVTAGRPLPEQMLAENPDDVHAGAANLRKQIENVRIHGVSPVVAINAFPTDHPSEHAAIREIADAMGVRSALCTHFAEGGKGAADLAAAVAEAAEELVTGGIPVLVCSRVPSGPVAPLYTGGGGADLARAGAVFAGDLSPWQARVLLVLALGADPTDPRALLDEHLT